MLKLRNYLKPFAGLLFIAILLLFVQAICDLSLPDYMSDIVNKGIQQGGIENAVPVAVRESEMNKLTIFMSQDDKTRVKQDYILVNNSSLDYENLVKKYPQLEKEPLYILKDISKFEIDKINLIMAKAFLATRGIEKTKSTSLGDNMVIQTATVLVKAEYETIGINIDKIQSNFIIKTGLVMLWISLFSAMCTIVVGLLAARTATGLAKNIRKDVFKKVEDFSNIEFDKFSTASLITRTTNDITQIQTLVVMAIRMIVYAPILGIGGVIKALNKSESMSWIIALAVIALLGLIISVFSVAIPKFKIIQKLVDRLNLVTRESLSGMMVIRAFNTEKFEEKRFDKANKELTDTNLFVNRVMVVLFPIMMFIMNGVTLLIVWVGAYQIANSNMQVGDMMAFMQYAMQIIMAFLMMSFMFIMVPRASVSAQRIAEVLEIEPSILDSKTPKHFAEKLKGKIEFKNVSFRYPGAEEDVLSNISFIAEPGKTTAFIGSTGSGKTTLINLIPRFYDVTNGLIEVDGIDIKDVTQFYLREHIGYIPQKGSLFQGTIETNLKYSDENASEETVNKAIEIAQAADFIREKEDGLNSEISQGGSNVSGGQKQRLSIARALVKKAEIYIFDDSFSALDFKTDVALRKALKSETASSTLLIVAQRISTIMHAEQIIVLDEGEIVGKGTHEELMKDCETYQEIALSQLSKEELA